MALALGALIVAPAAVSAEFCKHRNTFLILLFLRCCWPIAASCTFTSNCWSSSPSCPLTVFNVQQSENDVSANEKK